LAAPGTAFMSLCMLRRVPKIILMVPKLTFKHLSPHVVPCPKKYVSLSLLLFFKADVILDFSTQIRCLSNFCSILVRMSSIFKLKFWIV